jgi:membrane protein DedA with SNARE-associated domain
MRSLLERLRVGPNVPQARGGGHRAAAGRWPPRPAARASNARRAVCDTLTAMTHRNNSLVNFCTDFISNVGLPAVFLLMVLESACIPVPSEAIMLFAGFSVSQHKMSFALAVVAGVAGNLIGSWIAYAVGRYGGRPFVDRYGKYVLLRHHHLDVAERWFDRYGTPAVLFSRVLPIVRTFISLPAGVAKMSFGRFTLYTALGCIPWVIMLTAVGVKVGDNWEHIQKQLHYFDYVVLAGLVALLVWWLIRRRRAPAAAGPEA